jgi:nucleoside-diphosphate-sugar epimerase
MKTAVVLGAGGFIGHHMVRRLRAEGYWVRGVDLHRPRFTASRANEFVEIDLAQHLDMRDILEHQGSRVDEIYQFAANMGGAGFIFTGDNDSEIMATSAAININLLNTLRSSPGASRVFYSSSACVYPRHNQVDAQTLTTREESCYPADPDSEYGWEKLFSERLYQAHARNHGIDVRIARYHNVFGPEGAWQGGREKAPAALCRKVALAQDTIEIWGDGSQQRSFLYIDEAIEATRRLMQSSCQEVVNIGSEEMVTIDSMVDMLCEISGKQLQRMYVPAPTGVAARNSDNRKLELALGWCPSQPLRQGLDATYQWVAQEIEREFANEEEDLPL